MLARSAIGRRQARPARNPATASDCVGVRWAAAGSGPAIFAPANNGSGTAGKRWPQRACLVAPRIAARRRVPWEWRRRHHCPSNRHRQDAPDVDPARWTAAGRRLRDVVIRVHASHQPTGDIFRGSVEASYRKSLDRASREPHSPDRSRMCRTMTCALPSASCHSPSTARKFEARKTWR